MFRPAWEFPKNHPIILSVPASQSAFSSKPTIAFTFMKKRILVVDDFASIRDFVCETLQRKGYDTIGASNGTEAFALLSNNPEVDLVLTDYNMPDCTGFELLKKIKSTSSIAKVPVIFLTTESNPD